MQTSSGIFHQLLSINLDVVNRKALSSLVAVGRHYIWRSRWCFKQVRPSTVIQESFSVMAANKLIIPRRSISAFIPSRKDIAFGGRGAGIFRFASQSSRNYFRQKSANVSALFYLSGLTVLVVGLSYAAVPLYRVFCQSTGYGGETMKTYDASKLETMKKTSNRLIKVTFNADISSTMAWKFLPQQSEINVAPGETALAFYTATNPLDIPIIGIATYNVVPFEAGQYFNKIQCFCFEEQRLNPHEQVDMPVFFYIDPDYDDDPKMENIDVLTLSYTFFEAKEGISLPIPSYAKR